MDERTRSGTEKKEQREKVRKNRLIHRQFINSETEHGFVLFCGVHSIWICIVKFPENPKKRYKLLTEKRTNAILITV